MEAGAPGGSRWLLGAAGAVARRPSLWPTALRQVARLAAPGWWRRSPHLPLPSAPYLAFRLETQYGAAPEPRPDDVVTYLRWCREFPHGR
jgi:hypothetical protein